MHTDRTAAALTLTLMLGACARTPEPAATLSDDLRKDLAAATTSDLSPGGAAPGYQRMRFVSAIEQSKTATPAPRAKVSRHRIRPAVAARPANDAVTEEMPDHVMSTVAESPAPSVASTTEAPAPDPEPIHPSAGRPSPDPIPAPGGDASEPVAGRGDGGGGWGRVIGGIIGSVVIRGGHGGVDKCDPRTDGRPPMTVVDRPDFGMPLPVGRPTFPGSRH